MFHKEGNGEAGEGVYETTPVRVKKKVEESITDLSDITYIDAGMYHSAAVDIYGNYWLWGRNDNNKQ